MGVCLCSLQIQPDFEVDYESWLSFDEMYCYIKQVLLDNKKECPNPQTSFKAGPYFPPIDLMSFDGNVFIY